MPQLSGVSGYGRRTMAGLSGAGAVGSLSASTQGGSLFDWGGTQRFALEIVYPKAVGAAPNGLDSNNRCYYAYPGLTYSIQVCAIGGVYPYLYELSNAPEGMSIGAFTGTITWVNPQTSASNISVQVTDTKGSTTTETWSITVGTAGWNFLSPTGSDTTGTGAIDAPWQTIAKLQSSSASGSRTYLRAGTHSLAGCTVTPGGTGADNRIVFNGRSIVWVAYPGDAQPVIDLGSNHADNDTTPAIRPVGTHIYIDGLKFLNGFNKTFWVERTLTGRRGAHFRNCVFDTFGPAGTYGAGDNASAIMYIQTYGSGTSPDTQCYGDVIYGCSFLNPYGAGVDETDTPVAIKQYSWWKGLVANCTLTTDKTNWSEAGSQKSDNTQIEWRGNTLNNAGIDGNFGHHWSADKCSAEIRFNYFNGVGLNGLYMWHSKGVPPGGWEAEAVWLSRNTFRCRVKIENLGSVDGPYTFTNNVFVNADGTNAPWNYLLAGTDIQDSSVVVITTSRTPTGSQNLAGAASDSIIDANGLLTGSDRASYLGTQGHEIPA